jgi:hypothetical protein
MSSLREELARLKKTEADQAELEQLLNVLSGYRQSAIGNGGGDSLGLELLAVGPKIPKDQRTHSFSLRSP